MASSSIFLRIRKKLKETQGSLSYSEKFLVTQRRFFDLKSGNPESNFLSISKGLVCNISLFEYQTSKNYTLQSFAKFTAQYN